MIIWGVPIEAHGDVKVDSDVLYILEAVLARGYLSCAGTQPAFVVALHIMRNNPTWFTLDNFNGVLVARKTRAASLCVQLDKAIKPIRR